MWGWQDFSKKPPRSDVSRVYLICRYLSASGTRYIVIYVVIEFPCLKDSLHLRIF
ncbi:hypothetical protein BDN72DRAFT_836453, partial [Pluteus cervinus]